MIEIIVSIILLSTAVAFAAGVYLFIRACETLKEIHTNEKNRLVVTRDILIEEARIATTPQPIQEVKPAVHVKVHIDKVEAAPEKENAPILPFPYPEEPKE